MVDVEVEGLRKIGSLSLNSYSQIGAAKTSVDNGVDWVEPLAMIKELHIDRNAMVDHVRWAPELCSQARGLRSGSLL